jgi:hypothetical protein
VRRLFAKIYHERRADVSLFTIFCVKPHSTYTQVWQGQLLTKHAPGTPTKHALTQETDIFLSVKACFYIGCFYASVPFHGSMPPD